MEEKGKVGVSRKRGLITKEEGLSTKEEAFEYHGRGGRVPRKGVEYQGRRLNTKEEG